MKKYISILPLGLIFLVGCQSTQQAPFEPSVKNKNTNVAPVVTTNVSTFVYDPKGKEEFVFHTKAESLQKYGYGDFCPNTKSFSCFSNRLDYSKHLGMRGYFDSVEPAKKDYSGYEFYPVILENGEKYYFVANNKYGGKYGSSSPIISYKEHLNLKSFKSEPLIPLSPIQVIGISISYGSKMYELSNGKTISAGNLELIREVSKRFGNKSEIAELLLDMKISKDEIDFRFFVSPKGDSLKSDAQLYIGFNETSQWLRFKVKYYDDDWLFVNSYKVAADDYRWQSPKLTFKRDHSSGSVWEWIDVSAKAKEIEVAKALATSNKSTIRFQGNKYYSDKTLNTEQKESIQQVIKLFTLMEGA
jgi:hypothetical protein